jgi:hypothetical protein
MVRIMLNRSPTTQQISLSNNVPQRSSVLLAPQAKLKSKRPITRLDNLPLNSKSILHREHLSLVKFYLPKIEHTRKETYKLTPFFSLEKL